MAKAAGRRRLDVLLVERGLAESREQAQRLVMAGAVEVEGMARLKPGQQVPLDVIMRVKQTEKYVSRGGLKLEAALSNFQVDPADQICADIGASTGGFTDCLLQHGARRVYAVDVGRSQMHERVRTHERVVLVEHTNARNLSHDSFSERPTLLAVDVSFISLSIILPALAACSAEGATCIALIKPQFESEREEVSRGKGIIRDLDIHCRVLQKITGLAPDAGWKPEALMNSPIEGGSGNREFLILLHKVLPAQTLHAAALDIDAIVRKRG